jgi:hypothetical protein
MIYVSVQTVFLQLRPHFLGRTPTPSPRLAALNNITPLEIAAAICALEVLEHRRSRTKCFAW